MPPTDNIGVLVNPRISPDQLFAFYERNDICEKGFGKEVASRVLDYSSLIVGAFEGDKLVGIARVMFDGLDACIMELSLEVEYQGDALRWESGALIEKDTFALGRRIGQTLVNELLKMGATFIEAYVVEDCEEEFYESIGFEHNTGHLVYYIDKRPYVLEAQKDTEGEACN